jgi:hypothetical protein
MSIAPANTPARYIAIISGLCCGSPTVDPLPAQLMADYISGYTGNNNEQKTVAASIARVIIAGNSLYRTPYDPKADMMKKGVCSNITNRRHPTAAYLSNYY